MASWPRCVVDLAARREPRDGREGEDERVDDLVKFLQARVNEDEHRYAYVAHTFGGDVLLDSHLPMLDQVSMLVRTFEAMGPTDERYAGLEFALKVMAQSYFDHAGYRQEWQP